ncbi:UDP-glucose 4-epimerase GalE [bacterium]|nr:UDP-glucose 4-epimerase GalE [bacterium]
MTVLVTGGAGYIGSFTVAALLARGERVVVLDNLSAGHRAAVPPEASLIVAELADADLAGIFETHSIDAVIHFAALTSVPESVQKPYSYFHNNTANTLRLVEAMRQAGVDKIVFSSTAAVYGEPQSNPITEDHPKNPQSPYGQSKYFSEQILAAFLVAHGVRHVALRYFNASGGAIDRGEDHTPETHLIPIALQVALGQRKSMSIFGTDWPTPDGTCVRDYIHIADLADAHLRALDHLRSGGASLQLNLGNGAGYSVAEVIAAARRVTGHAIPAVEAPRRAGDPSTLVASSEAARRILGWQPKFADLESIVESAWRWHHAHPHGYGDRT